MYTSKFTRLHVYEVNRTVRSYSLKLGHAFFVASAGLIYSFSFHMMATNGCLSYGRGTVKIESVGVKIEPGRVTRRKTELRFISFTLLIITLHM